MLNYVPYVFTVALIHQLYLLQYLELVQNTEEIHHSALLCVPLQFQPLQAGILASEQHHPVKSIVLQTLVESIVAVHKHLQLLPRSSVAEITALEVAARDDECASLNKSRSRSLARPDAAIVYAYFLRLDLLPVPDLERAIFDHNSFRKRHQYMHCRLLLDPAFFESYA